MYTITTKLVEELTRRGVTFSYDTEVVQVNESKGKVSSVQDQHGKLYTADLFIINSDAASFRGKLLGRTKFNEQALDKMDWTLSPFTIYLGIKGRVEGLHHHNYFLGTNFQEYADKILQPKLPDQDE